MTLVIQVSNSTFSVAARDKEKEKAKVTAAQQQVEQKKSILEGELAVTLISNLLYHLQSIYHKSKAFKPLILYGMPYNN